MQENITKKLGFPYIFTPVNVKSSTWLIRLIGLRVNTKRRKYPNISGAVRSLSLNVQYALAGEEGHAFRHARPKLTISETVSAV